MTMNCNPKPLPSLVRQAERTILHFGMLSAGDQVICAVSGGPDSMALLHVLLALRSRFQVSLAVAHVNHGLRGAAADRDASLVQIQAGLLGLPYFVNSLDLDATCGSLEERGRNARYAFFAGLSQKHGFNRVALGHQADDNAEAVLMNLMRGSGLRGLSGIPPVRQRIIRPLIECRRSDILTYLDEQAISYAHDATNDDPRFERNRIRHRLIPLLQQQFNPEIVRILNRTAGLCRDEQAFWREYLEPLVAQVSIPAPEAALEVPIALLKPLARPVQRRLLREILRRWSGDLRRIGADHIAALIDNPAPRSAASCLRLPHSILAQTNGLRWRFHRAPRRPDRPITGPTSFAFTIGTPENLPLMLEVPETGDRLELQLSDPPTLDALKRSGPDQAWFDLDRLPFPLELRFAQPGDRLKPFGMAGTQKVSRLLADRKMPLEERGCVPVLLCADKLVWVIGVRRAAAAPVDKLTVRALRVCRWNHAGTQARRGTATINKDG